MLVIGLMSGTSADGIEVALARIEETPSGVERELVSHTTLGMDTRVRREVLRVAEGEACTAGKLSQLNFRLGEEFARAVLAGCKRFRVRAADVGLIGSHGQTLYHQGNAVKFLGRKTASTLQMGEPAVIAVRTGIPTVGDFRVADVASGGQGAPLVSYVDWILFGRGEKGRAVLNLGGIGNLTVLEGQRPKSGTFRRSRGGEGVARQTESQEHPNAKRSPARSVQPRTREETNNLIAPPAEPSGASDAATARVVAFDTGPGNMVVDALMAHYTDGRERFDRDAHLARRGNCLAPLLQELLDDPFLRQPPPKSTGREYFGAKYVERLRERGRHYGARPQDLVRTATLFTALSVVDALNRFVLPRVNVAELIVSGGGAKNPLVMAQLAAGLAPLPVITSDELGVPVAAKEAYAFALLGYETWRRRPSNLPSATGAKEAVVLGKLCWGDRSGAAERARTKTAWSTLAR